MESLWLLARYRDVIGIGQEINQNLNGHASFFAKLVEKVASILDTSYFFMLGVYQPENNSIDFHCSYGNGTPVHLKEMPLTGGSEWVIKERLVLSSFHLSSETMLQDQLSNLPGTAGTSPESIIFVPLTFRDEPLGVLSIQHERPYAFDPEDVRIMELLGNQVALALSNLRLFNYLETLNSTGQSLTRQLSSDQLLHEVAEQMRMATNADLVIIYPYHGEHAGFEQPYVSGTLFQPEGLSASARPDDIAFLTLSIGQPVWAVRSSALYEVLGGDTSMRQGYFEERERISSTAALALRITGEAVGVLFVNYRTPQSFSASQRNLISSLANYAAIAIKNFRKFSELGQRRRQELEALQKIYREISRSLNLHEVLEAILKKATEHIPAAEQASILLYNSLTRRLETEACTGSSVDVYKNLAIPVDQQKGLTVWVYLNRKPVRVDDVQSDPVWRETYYRVLSSTRSEMDVPVLYEDGVVGVISFESQQPGAFTIEDEAFLSTLAGQAAQAIMNAQVYERAESARRSLETLQEVAKEIIAQHGTTERVIQLIVKNARAIMGAEMGILQLYDEERPTKSYVTQVEGPLIQRADFEAGLKLFERGIGLHVAETRRPYITANAQKDMFYTGSSDIHSVITVPLISRANKLIGVLGLESPRQYAFNDEQLKVLEMFAEQAVIAIQNAQDYSHARSSAERFRLLVEVGGELSGLSDPSQLKQAYEIVLRNIWKFSDGEVLIRAYDESKHALVLASAARARQPPPEQVIPATEGIDGQVMRERRTFCIADVNDAPPGISPPATARGMNAIIVTPIQFETRYYGNLSLSHETPNSLSGADVALFEGLAQQLAITINRLETVRAQREAERQAQNLELLGALGQSAMELAHRLGNDLGLVGSYVDNIRESLAQAGVTNAEVEGDLANILSGVRNVLNLSRGLKQRFRDSEDGPGFSQPQTVLSVRLLLEDFISVLTLPENIKVETRFADDLGRINVVPAHFIDIFRNVLTNSVEAMSDGGSIRVEAFNSPPYVHVEVTNTGPAIPERLRAKIFDLFFSTKGSSGFGLWSARRYALTNGGDLSLKSSSAQGTTFVLRLPMAD